MKYIIFLLLVFSMRTEAAKPSYSDFWIFYCIGQSNSLGNGTKGTVDNQADSNVWVLRRSDKQWVHLADPLGNQSPNDTFQFWGTSFELTFAKTMASYYPDKKIGIIMGGRGATYLYTWMKGQRNQDTMLFNYVIRLFNHVKSLIFCSCSSRSLSYAAVL